MTIAKKYEDVVSERDAALAREAALREELERSTARYDREVLGLNNEGDPIGGDPAGGYKNDNARLQQRLTVAEQRLSKVEGACDLAMSAIDDDERGANFVKIIQAIKDKAALKPAAEGEGS